MAPKPQFTRNDIIDASFTVVRRTGWEGLSARTVANELKASTRPIYDHLKSMQKIEEEVYKKALAFFVDYISQERTGDKWLDQALGYVLFANKEKHLFRCLNDARYIHFQKQFAKDHWVRLGEQLSDDERFQGLPEKVSNRIRFVRWIFVHGLASLVNSGRYAILESEKPSVLLALEETGIDLTSMLKKANQGLYEEFKT